MRFNRRNWNKYFDGSKKVTTIRLKKSPLGHKRAWAGSYLKPQLLGEFDIVAVIERFYDDLTEQDAKNDGFECLTLLKEELTKLNGNIPATTLLFIHSTINVTEVKSGLKNADGLLGIPPTPKGAGTLPNDI
jgi:hypothetical protein